MVNPLYINTIGNTFLVSMCTSLAMMSNRDVISDARHSAKAALSRDTLRVSDNSDTQKLNVDRTSFLQIVPYPIMCRAQQPARSITYRRFRCFVLFSNLSQIRSKLRAYSYSTSPRRLKYSWNSASSESFESILNSSEANWSDICRRISAHNSRHVILVAQALRLMSF